MNRAILLPVLVLLAIIYQVESAPNRRTRDAAVEETDTISERQSKLEDNFKEKATPPQEPKNRRNKALNLFSGYYPSFLSSSLDYSEDDDDDVTFAVSDDHFDEDDISRTIPSKRRQQNKKKNGSGDNYPNDSLNSLQYDNSPIFYIRLPPTPYMFVPGLGYVSQPPSLGPAMPPMLPQGVPPQADPFINLPIDFVSNGKPTGVYQWNGNPGYSPVDPFGYGSQPVMPPAPRPSYNTQSYKPKPKPAPTNSKITNLKGPYVFNGKPEGDVYVLRDTYNSIYSDALQNFYP